VDVVSYSPSIVTSNYGFICSRLRDIQLASENGMTLTLTGLGFVQGY